MQNSIYNENERQFYTPRPDYKIEADGFLRKEQLPVDIRTGQMASVRLTIDKVEHRHCTWINPENKKSNEKPQWVLYFKEKYFYTLKKGNENVKEIWSLPLALNKTNAQHILLKTGNLDMKKTVGYIVELYYASDIPLGKKVVGGIRISNIISPILNKITKEQVLELQNLCKNAGKNETDICNAYKIDSLDDLPVERFELIKQRLIDIATNNK